VADLLRPRPIPFAVGAPRVDWKAHSKRELIVGTVLEGDRLFRTERSRALKEIRHRKKFGENSSPLGFSGRNGEFRGKADNPHQFLKTRIGPQAVHAGIEVKINRPVGMLFEGFLQVFERAIIFS
jgi:hypothetical protein